MKRSPMNRGKGLKRGGRKVHEWADIRAILVPAFLEAGITSCELRLDEKCTGSYNCAFAHSKKRVAIGPYNSNKAGLCEVVLACQHCHDIIEHTYGPDGMWLIVTLTIGCRVTPVIIPEEVEDGGFD